jgi:hypothetical protein
MPQGVFRNRPVGGKQSQLGVALSSGGRTINGGLLMNPILVTGAAGAVGGIGRNLTEFLLARGHKVRALVRREDERAEALHHVQAHRRSTDEHARLREAPCR